MRKSIHLQILLLLPLPSFQEQFLQSTCLVEFVQKNLCCNQNYKNCGSSFDIAPTSYFIWIFDQYPNLHIRIKRIDVKRNI